MTDSVKQASSGGLPAAGEGDHCHGPRHAGHAGTVYRQLGVQCATLHLPSHGHTPILRVGTSSRCMLYALHSGPAGVHVVQHWPPRKDTFLHQEGDTVFVCIV